VRTFCCGGGGGNSFYQVEQEERRISTLRYEQLAETGAGKLAVSCPFCLTMLRDASAAHGEGGLAVVDVAEELMARVGLDAAAAEGGDAG
jgi:Fe-S oxidoreductase